MHAPTSARRPGGLTVLVVLNVALAAIGLLGGAGMTAMNSDPEEMLRQADEMERLADHPPAGQDAQLHRNVLHTMAEQLRHPAPAGFRLMSALGYTGGVLLVISAFGLLGRRRLLGKHVAVGAGIALTGCAIVAMATQSLFFWGFPIVGLVYGIVLVTLILAVYRRILVE
jgi:hypothetical protein